jgi:serine/threonine-protein kinase
MPWEHVVAIMDQACRALAEAHALGIVHRDLKPANLFIVKRPDGRRVVKLLDFGVSKLDLPREAPITKQGDILGSPRYMSPEQVRAMPLDGRSDIWAAGVVIYELLTGIAPFAAPNFAVACRRVLDEEPTPLRTLRPDVPLGLAAVVARCLEKDRDKRFPDALQLRDALAPFGMMSHRTGSQRTLPDIGELLSSDVPAMPVIPPPSPSIAPDPGAALDPLSMPSVPPASSVPPSSSAPPSSSVPPSSSLPASGGSTIADPSSPSLSTDVRISHDATTIAVQPRSRRFVWIAVATLAIGLAIGLAMVVRGREPGPPRGPRAAAASTNDSAPRSSGPPAVTPKIAGDPSPSATGSSPQATSGSAPPTAGSTTSSAPADTGGEPSSKPWRRPGSVSAPTSKSPLPKADPFGERRQ